MAAVNDAQTAWLRLFISLTVLGMCVRILTLTIAAICARIHTHTCPTSTSRKDRP